MAEVKTLTFPNNPKGQTQKAQAIAEMAEQGWRVISETISDGRLKGGKACCFATICLPLAFLAGKTDGTITVTLQKD